MTPTPEYLTKRQVADLLQVSMRQVELLTHRRRISQPIYLGSSSPRWMRDELLASIGAASSQSEVAQ